MKEWKGLPIVIFGYGGIATEASYLINSINSCSNSDVFEFIGYVSEKETEIGKYNFEFPIITSDNMFEEFSKKFRILGVIITHGNPAVKKKIFDKIKHIDNIVFPNIIHPSVEFEKDYVSLGVGNMITADVKFTCNIKLGSFNLLNLGCTIGHEVAIDDYATINPLTAVSGGVWIKEGVFIGTGAKILQYKMLGEYSVIGAGAVVINDIESYSTVVGVPAKCIKKNRFNV